MTASDRLGSTYRLQLNGTGFKRAQALVPYLHALGIETLYASPVLAAAPDSTHGYDVIDPTRLDPALGSDEEYAGLLDALGAHGMRLLLDIVPNHMATVPANEWWWDTLRQGESSPDAAVFDIDWTQHGGRVLLPVLGRPVGDLLAEDALREDPESGMLAADGQQLPLAPGTPGRPLPELLASQHFRAAFWRLGDTAGNYRRFFNVDGLVGVRVEDADIFDRTHAYIRELLGDVRVAGVRIDHIDGLSDPTAYLARLHEALNGAGRRPVVLVEKIVQHDETTDSRWLVDGTTGYEFADRALGLFVDAPGDQALTDLGSALTGYPASFETLGLQAKREMLRHTFSAQLDRVARLALVALDAGEPGHDLSITDVRDGIVELTVSLDVYRTYLDGGLPTRADAATLARAQVSRRARGANTPEAERAATLLTQGLLTATGGGGGGPWVEMAMRWQQLTGAVMAKGVEDTATYRYDGMLSHADVGSNPDHAVCEPAAFHHFVRRRARTTAHSGLNTTSTHDSKRNEDARCRLVVLSEASAEWDRLVRRWRRRFSGTARSPQPHDELFALQTLLAMWPVENAGPSRPEMRRIQEYLRKAAREARRCTSWTEPDSRYERLLRSYATSVTQDERFRAEMGQFVRSIAPAAVTNSLALTVLKTCGPGVPDFYQGTELFEPTLTDPDNRLPVDFSHRVALLESLPELPADGTTGPSQAARLLATWPDGRIKLHVARAALHLRRQWPELFADGSYVPLGSTGRRADNVVGWARRRGRHTVVAIVPRLMLHHAGMGRFATGSPVWSATACTLPKTAPDEYVDVLSGQTIRATRGRLQVAQALGTLPVAILRSVH